MTVSEAVARFDLLYPNSLTAAQKIHMLSELDGRVFSEILSLYPIGPESFSEYSANTPNTSVLLVPFPYDDIYIKFLAMQNDYINGDINRFNNSASLFNRSYADFSGKMNRQNRVKQTANIRL